MATTLQICRDVLEEAYRLRLGTTFSGSIAEISQGRQPVWRNVSDSDLTTEREPHATGAAGLLLDPEIGLLLYILPFGSRINLHKQIVRALGLRSKLAVEKNYIKSDSEGRDRRGSWRVAVHWLVDQHQLSQWVGQVEKIRRDTAFSEELSLDPIVLSDGDVKAQLERYGFPRLLITTREVFKKQRLEDITGWLSADELVKTELSTFDSHFQHTDQREYAKEVMREIVRFAAKRPTASANPTIRKIRKIHIRNFRNLRDVRFDFGVPAVSANVVHGPNGTGKSSLCEAISISLFNSSFRYKRFSDSKTEKDISAHDRAREYLTNYLTPLEDGHLTPEIAIDDRPLAPPQLLTGDSVTEGELNMAATILTQDSAVEFARMPANELGARVLRGYSELAEYLENFTDSRVSQANEGRQRFLRNLGLSAAITKITTAYERIARREIDQSLPPYPKSLVTWLEVVSRLTGFGVGLAARWEGWGGEDARSQIAARIASLRDRPSELAREIRKWLYGFQELITASEEAVQKFRESPLAQQDPQQLSVQLAALGEWAQRLPPEPANATREVGPLREHLTALEATQRGILEKGQDAKIHLEHLIGVEAFVRDVWTKRHANNCPTCGADYAAQGGILSIIETLRASVASERDGLRNEYQILQDKLTKIRKELLDAGQYEPPLSDEEQLRLAEAVRLLIPSTTSLTEWVRIGSQRAELIGTINALTQIPSVPAPIDIDSESQRVASKILVEFTEADRTFEAPNSWKPVKAKLTETLAGVVRRHLPDTLAKLWCELAMNLTSASWVLPQRPCLDISTRRGEQLSTVRVKDRLARYILNQSEIHTLGLAWFFTSYLTRGRFFNACLVMDDPAQELDQTSYRDLCRLWETMVRLHKVYSRSLKLIIMLNQETRAVEAARATGGALYVFDWSRDQDGPFRRMNVIGRGLYPLEPTTLFERTG